MYAKICSTKESLVLDSSLKTIAKQVLKDLQTTYPDLTFERRYKSKNHSAGCQPDGGIWYYQGRLILAAEAKHQGKGGNAIERWYKNNFVLRQISSTFTYITYVTGAGAVDNGIICKILSPAHPQGYNNYYLGANVCYTEPEGFLPQVIYESLKGAIIDQIQAYFYE